jgi:HK97 family phage prohead protease/HK97 family phage major capsid protein
MAIVTKGMREFASRMNQGAEEWLARERHTMCPEFKKAPNATGDWLIDGYASTDAIDSYNEIVAPESFAAYLSEFAQFPIALINHRWFDLPIGKVEQAELRPKGLWVNVFISKTAHDIWTLIEEEILKAFSIGFNGIAGEQSPNGGPWIWRQIQLLEISIVNIPANREALFAVAQSKGFDLSRFRQSTAVQPHQKTGGTGMPELTLDQVKGVVADELKAISPTLETAAKQAAADAVRSHVNTIEAVKGDLTRQLSDISKALQGCATKSETEEMQKKTMADLGAVVAESNRLNAKGLANQAGDFGLGMKAVTPIEMDIAGEMNTAPLHVRALINKPDHLTLNANDQDLIKRFQVASDEIHMLDVILGATQGNQYRGPQSLKAWPKYSRLVAEYRKTAGDPLYTGGSGLGSEWIPTGFSAQLQERIELLAVVAGLFPRFTMPTKTYTWPVRGARGTAYLWPESTAVADTKITSATPGTSNVSFTAIKLAMRGFTSSEEIEDSIVAILPFLQEEIATTLARAIDDAILNGDITTAHMDTDYETVATHVARAWKGLRKSCFVGGGSGLTAASAIPVTDESGAAYTAAKFLALWAKMKNFAQPSSDVAFVSNMKAYMQLLADTAFSSMANFGANATVNGGKLISPFGVQMVISDYARSATNSVGVNGASANTFNVAQFVNKRAWMIGDRRNVTLKSQELIETDQVVMVGTWRGDFKQVIANSGTAAGSSFAQVLSYDIL